MNLTPLILEPLPPLPPFSVSPQAEQERDELILVVRSFAVVKTSVEANSLGEAMRDLRTHIAGVTEQNLKWRRPVNDALSRSITIEKEYMVPALAELELAERIQGEFHAAERRRVAEEERLRRENIARLERERQATEQKAREEQNRIDHATRDGANLAQAALDAAKNQKQRAAALKADKERQEALAAQQMASDALAQQAKAASAASEAAMRAPVPEVHKVAGVATKRVMEFDVVDIKAVFAVRPELCEPLAIKKSAVRAVCTPKFLPASNEVDDTSVPGLRLFWRDDTTTRRWDR